MRKKVGPAELYSLSFCIHYTPSSYETKGQGRLKSQKVLSSNSLQQRFVITTVNF